MTRYIPVDTALWLIFLLFIVTSALIIWNLMARNKVFLYIRNHQKKLYAELGEPSVSFWKPDFRKSTNMHWKLILNQIKLNDEEYKARLRNFRISWLVLVIWLFAS